MEESFENKLLKVDLIDIYDDIAAINLSQDEVIQLCTAFTCRVNLTVGNVLYAVEEKYKEKLVNYRNSKRIKWLRLNLKAIMPNPEEKFLKWQQKHKKSKKLSWIKRKLFALDYFSNEALVFNSEDPCCSHSLVMASERQSNQNTPNTHNEQFGSRKDLTHENSGCMSIDNTSTESVQTVIASQPKNAQESSDGASFSPLINFRNVSRSILSSSSGELPSLCSEDAITPHENEAQSNPTINRKVSKQREQSTNKILPLLQESEGISSQEDAYVTFYQDMQVTSTQEFG